LAEIASNKKPGILSGFFIAVNEVLFSSDQANVVRAYA